MSRKGERSFRWWASSDIGNAPVTLVFRLHKGGADPKLGAQSLRQKLVYGGRAHGAADPVAGDHGKLKGKGLPNIFSAASASPAFKAFLILVELMEAPSKLTAPATESSTPFSAHSFLRSAASPEAFLPKRKSSPQMNLAFMDFEEYFPEEILRLHVLPFQTGVFLNILCRSPRLLLVLLREEILRAAGKRLGGILREVKTAGAKPRRGRN